VYKSSEGSGWDEEAVSDFVPISSDFWLNFLKNEQHFKRLQNWFCSSYSFFSDFCAIISRNKSLDFIKASAFLTLFLYQSHVGWRLEENCFHVITGGIKSFNKKISSHLWNAFFNCV
jgi:hypothetical protein